MVEVCAWTVDRSSGCQFLACRQTIGLDGWLIIVVVCLDGQLARLSVWVLDGWLVVGLCAWACGVNFGCYGHNGSPLRRTVGVKIGNRMSN